MLEDAPNKVASGFILDFKNVQNDNLIERVADSKMTAKLYLTHGLWFPYINPRNDNDKPRDKPFALN